MNCVTLNTQTPEIIASKFPTPKSSDIKIPLATQSSPKKQNTLSQEYCFFDPMNSTPPNDFIKTLQQRYKNY